MKRLLIMAVVLVLNVCAFAEGPIWMRLGKTFNVKGGAGIEQFVEAVFETKKADWYADPIFDKANGYFEYMEEGSGMSHYWLSYWNRKDGKKLVIASYLNTDFGKKIKAQSSVWGYRYTEPLEDTPGEGIIKDGGFMAYLYDATKKQLVPLSAPPFNGWKEKMNAIHVLVLPRSGKDIRVKEECADGEYIYHTLKWNGMTFDFQREGNEAVELYQVGVGKICNAPNGKVVDKLPKDGNYIMLIDKIVDGWCHIEDGRAVCAACAEQDEVYSFHGSTSGYWIHNSVIGAKGLGSGGITLYTSPSEKSKVTFKSDDYTIFHPIELHGEWLKVYVTVRGVKKEGWMKTDNICSNPLTNCC